MATRSTIGILNSDGTVEAVYCHWDGYPEHNGKILVENYTTESKVRELISMGGISSLGPDIDAAHTTFYKRDRGEMGAVPQGFANLTEFVENFGEEYNYLFTGDVWYANQYGSSYNGTAMFDTVLELLLDREAEQCM
jgi:hypothetical protein